MQRISTSGATDSLPEVLEAVTDPGFFQKGDATQGVEPTQIGQDWLNHIQEEIARSIEAKGIELDKESFSQMAQSLTKLKYHWVSESGFMIEGDDLIQVVLVETGSSDRGVTLPDPSLVLGRVVVVSKVDTGSGKVYFSQPVGSPMDVGPVDEDLTQKNSSVMYLATSSGWVVMSRSKPSGEIAETMSASDANTIIDAADSNADASEGGRGLLRYYNEDTVTLSNSGGHDLSGKFHVERINDTVTITFENLSHDPTGFAFTDSNVIPSWAVPAVPIANWYHHQTAGFNFIRIVEVYTQGRLSFSYSDLEDGSSRSFGETSSGSITYSVKSFS